MKVINNLIGNRYGRLVVKELYGRKSGRVMWSCICDCGGNAITSTTQLKTNNKLSCGCLPLELLRLRSYKHGLSHRKDVWKVWEGMISRCKNEGNISYKNYGGRGITVCDSWLNIEEFYKDMGDRPIGHSLERINNDLGYFKENCKWASKTEQARNRRTSKKWFIKNKIFETSTEAAKYFNVSHQAIIAWCKNEKLKDCYSVLKY